MALAVILWVSATPFESWVSPDDVVPFCTMENVWPPIVTVPVLWLVELFDDTVTVTVPLPVPEVGVADTQLRLSVAVHAHPLCVVTVTDAEPPVDAKL